MSSDWSNKRWDNARYASMIKNLTKDNGKLLSSTTIGDFPIYYTNKQSEALCSECADEEVFNLVAAHLWTSKYMLSCDECRVDIAV